MLKFHCLYKGKECEYAHENGDCVLGCNNCLYEKSGSELDNDDLDNRLMDYDTFDDEDI